MANNSGVKLLVVVAVVVAGYFGVNAYLRPTAAVVTATGGKVAKAVPAQIKVRAEKALEIKLEAGGSIVNDLEDGAEISAGDVVVQIDTRAKMLEIEGLENSLTSSRAQNELYKKSRASTLKRAQEGLKRNEAELKAGRLSQLGYDQAAAQVDDLELRQSLDQVVADEAIARSENQIKTRQLELEKLTFKAPFPGSLTNLQVTQSTVVSGGQVVGTLITNTRVVEARISEENFSKGVAEGMHVRVRFTGLDRDFTGTVGKILPTQEDRTLRYVAYLNLDNMDASVLRKTGQSGDGVITIDEREAKVRVPRRAIYDNQLYVVRSGTVEIRIPKVGYDSGGVAEILSGLVAGETVIVDQQELFKAGQSVRTKDAALEAK